MYTYNNNYNEIRRRNNDDKNKSIIIKYMAFYNHFDLNRWIILTSMNLIAILGYTYNETKSI